MSPGHPLVERTGSNQIAACSMVFQRLADPPWGRCPPEDPPVSPARCDPPLLKSANHIWLPDVELDLHESG